MTVMSGSLYRALIAGHVPDELAQKAAEDIARCDERFQKIESDLLMLKWMVGLVLAGVVTTILKSFF